LFGLLLLTGLIGSMTPAALAAADASLRSAADGTLVVVGQGWQPGQKLVVSLGRERFAAYTDSGGTFEVATGLTSYSGSIAVHRFDESGLAFAALDTMETADAPSPMAVMFAQTLAEGAALFCIVAGVLMLGYSAARPLRRRR
jgi:hypothetical protein